jgi:prepilin-type N-terminal cleavage/methylation domain-containing protein
VVRAAFTLIELIFAIVIIAIIVMGVPQIISENTKHVEANLLQEGIFAASDTAAKILTYPWDAKQLDVNITEAYAKVLDLDGNGSGRIGILPLRIGHINQDLHRRYYSIITEPNAATLANVNDGLTASLGVYTITTSSGYSDVETSNIFGLISSTQNTQVDRTNIKMTEINASSEFGDVILRTYVANIGEIDYAKRTFQ